MSTPRRDARGRFLPASASIGTIPVADTSANTASYDIGGYGKSYSTAVAASEAIARAEAIMEEEDRRRRSVRGRLGAFFGRLFGR